MTRKDVETIMNDIRLPRILTGKGLSRCLKISYNAVAAAAAQGRLRQVDRGTFFIADVIDWLFKEPRFMARVYLETMDDQPYSAGCSGDIQSEEGDGSADLPPVPASGSGEAAEHQGQVGSDICGTDGAGMAAESDKMEGPRTGETGGGYQEGVNG